MRKNLRKEDPYTRKSVNEIKEDVLKRITKEQSTEGISKKCLHAKEMAVIHFFIWKFLNDVLYVCLVIFTLRECKVEDYAAWELNIRAIAHLGGCVWGIQGKKSSVYIAIFSTRLWNARSIKTIS